MERVIALGFFDGVHLGHGQLLSRCRQEADRLGCQAAALTFDRHPDTLVLGTPVRLLSSLPDRKKLMSQLYGVEEVLTLQFDEAMRDMAWTDFLQDILVNRYHAVGLICGHDFRFGAGGQGTAARLQEMAARMGLSCAVAPEYRLDGIPVSSTYIRQLLAEGDLDRARRFLGHPHLLSGKVVQGQHLGRTMGIPTANLVPDPELLLPPRGVYACRVRTATGVYMAVTNIGVPPTVGGSTLTVEPWLLDYHGDLYGQEVTLELWHYLRPERKFPTLEALQGEIRANAVQTREFFADRTKK